MVCCWLLSFVCRRCALLLFVVGCSLLVVCCLSKFVARFSLSVGVVSCWLLVVGCSLPVVVACCLLFVVAVCCLLL